jgi:hypothetical protein
MNISLQQLSTLALRPSDRKLVKDFWESLLVVTAMGAFLVCEAAWYTGREAIASGRIVRRLWNAYGRDQWAYQLKPCAIALVLAATWLLEAALPYIEENAALWLYWVAQLPAEWNRELEMSYGDLRQLQPRVIVVMDRVLGLA